MLKLCLTFLFGIAIVAHATKASATLVVSSGETVNVSCSSSVCMATEKKAVLNAAELAGMLASGDVKIISAIVAKDIEINAALSWTSTHRLTLDSYRAITFNKPLVVAGTGALTITTNDGGRDGDFGFFGKGHVEFWNLDSSLVINGQSYVLEKSLKELARDIKHGPQDNYALAKSINEKNHTYRQSPIPAFSGNFEGLGNTIFHLVIDNSSGAQYVGLFGELIGAAVVRDAVVSVDINGRDAVSVGALAGLLTDNSAVKGCAASGQISGGGHFIGGLVGESLFAWLSNSRASVALSGNDGSNAVGGLVGYLYGDCKIGCTRTLDHSFASGAVTGGNGTSVGGLVGYSFGGIVTNSYATGSVAGGGNALVGGLIGTSTDNTDVHAGPVVSASYSIGSVSGGSGAMIGGLIGQDAADSQITDSYWDMETSGIGDPHRGAGNIVDDEGITGLTTEQFKAGLPAGFDPSIWKEKAELNTGYPYLLTNPPPK